MRKAINHLKKSDPVMRAIIESLGPCKIDYGEPSFASLSETIVYQQLHGKAAATIFRRFLDLAGRPLTPQGVIRLTDEQMRSAGLSKQKLSYLRSLAELTHSGELNFEQLPSMSNEDVIAHLTQVKGIGTWTAQIFLMFTLQRPDILPTGDLGIQMAMQKHYRKRKLPKPKDMEKIAKRWSPYRTYACWYLWKSVDTKKKA
jgi:DNA-3-methyladenine glycosylase II